MSFDKLLVGLPCFGLAVYAIYGLTTCEVYALIGTSGNSEIALVRGATKYVACSFYVLVAMSLLVYLVPERSWARYVDASGYYSKFMVGRFIGGVALCVHLFVLPLSYQAETDSCSDEKARKVICDCDE